jgi:hypothetical protein
MIHRIAEHVVILVILFGIAGPLAAATAIKANVDGNDVSAKRPVPG